MTFTPPTPEERVAARVARAAVEAERRARALQHAAAHPVKRDANLDLMLGAISKSLR